MLGMPSGPVFFLASIRVSKLNIPPTVKTTPSSLGKGGLDIELFLSSFVNVGSKKIH